MRCVVNFARAGRWPNTWYPKGQARLRQSLEDTGWKEGLLLYTDEQALKVPSHQMLPYAFKPAALMEAWKKGFDTLLWADASVFAIRPIEPIFEHIEEHGYVFFQAGFNCAQWTNDTCLSQLGVNRDEAEHMPMYLALCFGLDLRHKHSKTFLERLSQEAQKGISFPGSWSNVNGTESKDSRCQGHRHDQSVGSILAAKLDMKLTEPILLDYYSKGMYQYGKANDMSAVDSRTVLLAQGMYCDT